MIPLWSLYIADIGIHHDFEVYVKYLCEVYLPGILYDTIALVGIYGASTYLDLVAKASAVHKNRNLDVDHTPDLDSRADLRFEILIRSKSDKAGRANKYAYLPRESRYPYMIYSGLIVLSI